MKKDGQLFLKPQDAYEKTLATSKKPQDAYEKPWATTVPKNPCNL
jgi:hypothetical protein